VGEDEGHDRQADQDEDQRGQPLNDETSQHRGTFNA
jgi:hypothetical protein